MDKKYTQEAISQRIKDRLSRPPVGGSLIEVLRQAAQKRLPKLPKV